MNKEIMELRKLSGLDELTKIKSAKSIVNEAAYTFDDMDSLTQDANNSINLIEKSIVKFYKSFLAMKKEYQNGKYDNARDYSRIMSQNAKILSDRASYMVYVCGAIIEEMESEERFSKFKEKHGI